MKDFADHFEQVDIKLYLLNIFRLNYLCIEFRAVEQMSIENRDDWIETIWVNKSLGLLLEVLFCVISRAHDALVEHGNGPLDKRQERFLKRDIIADGALYLQEVDDIVAQHTVLVILVIQFGDILKKTSRSWGLQVELLGMQTIYIEPRRLFRVNLTVISDGLYRNVNRVLVTQRQQLIYLVKDPTQYLHILPISLICLLQAYQPSVPVQRPQTLILYWKSLNGVGRSTGQWLLWYEKLNKLFEYDLLLLFLVVSEKLIMGWELLEEPEDAHPYEGVGRGVNQLVEDEGVNESLVGGGHFE